MSDETPGLPPQARTADALDIGAGAPFTLETARVALVFIQRDFREIRRHVEENGRLDEIDRQNIARLGERLDAALSRFDAMNDPAPNRGDSAGWHDNAERTVGRVLDSSPGRILALCALVVTLGLFIVAGILAYKGDLDDVVRGAFTPGTEVVDVPKGTTVDTPPAGDAEVIE